MVSRRVSIVEQGLITLPEHSSSPTIVSGIRVARSLIFCVAVCISLFVLFLLAIVLSALIRYTDSDYPFGIFKLFCHVHILFTVCKQLHRVNSATLTVTIQDLRRLFLCFKKKSIKGTNQMLSMQKVISFIYNIIYFAMPVT